MKSTLKDVFHFLEIPALSDGVMDSILNQTRRHVTANKTGSVLPETRELLRSYYSECNEETSRLLNDERFLWLDHYS
ncbi:hypothetical protein Btru_045745 [Bulinus truncatus]|nr:hypothetical protein Btru_045745 [Bulinus truncatus]